MPSIVGKVLLTFDVEGPPSREDHVEPETISALYYLLKLLEKHNFQALFFITGSFAEKLAKYPKVLDLLRAHEIGYHSSSHSVKPRIFEYTDVESYEEAVQISMERENSSIDLSTGDILGKGGISTLRQVFPDKTIDSFRAPFLCWSPPHLEALRKMGFHFDFSADVCNTPSFYKGITFMPYPTPIDSVFHNLDIILKRILNEKIVVFLAHPSQIIFRAGKNRHNPGNSFVPIQIVRRSNIAVQSEFLELELFLFGLRRLQKAGITKVYSSVEESKKPLDLEKVDVTKVYEASLRAPKKIFGYTPKFLLPHFYHFFRTRV